MNEATTKMYRVDDGPKVIDEGDYCENCDTEIPLGVRVKLVELADNLIEQWCHRCASRVSSDG